MKVEDYMSKNLILVEKSAHVSAAKEILETNGFRHLPVVENGKIVGIVSDRDINRTTAISESIKEICGMEEDLATTVDKIMVSNFLSISREEDLKDAAQMMIDNKIGCLPVIENDELVGIITETDILWAFVETA